MGTRPGRPLDSQRATRNSGTMSKAQATAEELVTMIEMGEAPITWSGA